MSLGGISSGFLKPFPQNFPYAEETFDQALNAVEAEQIRNQENGIATAAENARLLQVQNEERINAQRNDPSDEPA